MFAERDVIGAAPGGTTGLTVLFLLVVGELAAAPPVLAACALAAPVVRSAMLKNNALLMRDRKTTPLSSASGVS
jgi:hypothetical protein